MKQATFIAKIADNKKIEVPVEVRERLNLLPGDAVEVSLKKIKPRRFEILISENPLYKLLKVTKNEKD